jgi:hypothetical protein
VLSTHFSAASTSAGQKPTSTKKSGPDGFLPIEMVEDVHSQLSSARRRRRRSVFDII